MTAMSQHQVQEAGQQGLLIAYLNASTPGIKFIISFSLLTH